MGIYPEKKRQFRPDVFLLWFIFLIINNQFMAMIGPLFIETFHCHYHIKCKWFNRLEENEL